MKLTNMFLIAGMFLLLAGCAHHRDVRPGADGVNNVVIHTDDEERGAREALEQAEHFCQQSGRMPGIIDEKKNYVGDMKEDNYKTAKKAAKVASAVGGAAWVFGGKNESAAGGIVGLGGGIADAAIGNGYTVVMKFKCQ